MLCLHFIKSTRTHYIIACSLQQKGLLYKNGTITFYIHAFDCKAVTETCINRYETGYSIYYKTHLSHDLPCNV